MIKFLCDQITTAGADVSESGSYMDGMYKAGQIDQLVPNLQYLFKTRIDLDVACLPVWQLYRDHQHDAIRECRRNDYPSVIGFDTLDYSG